MSHTDHETRVLAHRVFSTVLMPSLSQPSSDHKAGILPLLSWKVTNGSFSIHSGNKDKPETIDEGTGEKKNHALEQHGKHATESLFRGGINHSLPDGKTV